MKSIGSIASIVECAGARPAPATTQLSSHLIEVTAGGVVLGFVEIADSVFVALAGSHYDRAVEVGQALDLEHAVATFAA